MSVAASRQGPPTFSGMMSVVVEPMSNSMAGKPRRNDLQTRANACQLLAAASFGHSRARLVETNRPSTQYTRPGDSPAAIKMPSRIARTPSALLPKQSAQFTGHRCYQPFRSPGLLSTSRPNSSANRAGELPHGQMARSSLPSTVGRFQIRPANINPEPTHRR